MYSISYLTHDICMASYVEREKDRKKERKKPDDLGNVRTCIQYHGRQMMKKKKGESCQVEHERVGLLKNDAM